MSVQVASYPTVASRRTRVRATVVGVVIAWTMAAVFLFLGWKSRGDNAQQRDTTSVVMQAG